MTGPSTTNRLRDLAIGVIVALAAAAAAVVVASFFVMLFINLTGLAAYIGLANISFVETVGLVLTTATLGATASKT